MILTFWTNQQIAEWFGVKTKVFVNKSVFEAFKDKTGLSLHKKTYLHGLRQHQRFAEQEMRSKWAARIL